jgi:hypothetical protein
MTGGKRIAADFFASGGKNLRYPAESDSNRPLGPPPFFLISFAPWRLCVLARAPCPFGFASSKAAEGE